MGARAAESLHYARADLTNNLKDSSNCPGWSGMIQWAIQTGGSCNTGGSFTVLNCLNDQTKKIFPGETIHGECQLSGLPSGDLSTYCLRITWCGKTRDLSGVRDDEYIHSVVQGPIAVAEAGDYWNRIGERTYSEEDLWVTDWTDFPVNVDFRGSHSSSPSGESLTCEWEFQGGILTSENCRSLRLCSVVEPSKETISCSGPVGGRIFGRSYIANGDYPVRLTVKDSKGLTNTDTIIIHIKSLPEGSDPDNTCKKLGGSCYCQEGGACGPWNMISGSIDCPNSCYGSAGSKSCSELGGSCLCPDGQECLTANKMFGSSDCADSCCKCTAKQAAEEEAILEAGLAGQTKGLSVTAHVGEKVFFDVSKSHLSAGHEIVRWILKYGDGKEVNYVALSASDLEHVYSAPGTYYAQLSILDEPARNSNFWWFDSPDITITVVQGSNAATCKSLAGKCACSDGEECLPENKVSGSSDCADTCCKCTVKAVVENQPPVADAKLRAKGAGSYCSGTCTIPPGVQIELSGEGSSDPDGSVVYYTWEFAGSASGSHGAVSPVLTLNPVYSEGTYTVTLTVKDDKGATAKSEPISLTIKAENKEALCESLGGSCSCPDGQECKEKNKVSGSTDCADGCCKCTVKSVDNPVASLFVSKQGGSKAESVSAGLGEILDFDPTGSVVPSGYSLETWVVNFAYKKDGVVVDRYGGDWNKVPLRVLSHSFDSAGVYTVLLSLYILGPDGEELTFTDEVSVDVSAGGSEPVGQSCASLGGSCSCTGGKECLAENKITGSSDCAGSCCRCTDDAVAAKSCQELGGSCSCPAGQECKPENAITGSGDCEGTCCKCTDITYKLRLLFVPMDWSFDLTQTSEQERFKAQVDTLKSYLASKIPLSGCPEKIFVDYSFSVCIANYPSDYQTLESEEALAVSQNRIDKYQQALIDCKNALDASKVASADQVLFVSDKNLAGGIAGTSYKTSGLIWFDMFYDAGTKKTLVHELGHKWGLADEYFDGCTCSSFNPCYNRLDENYNGGDPYGSYAGAAKQGMSSPYCSTSGTSQCPQQGGTVFCEGNMNANNGRCIMSHGDAAEPREFCPLCMAHLNTLDQLKCN